MSDAIVEGRSSSAEAGTDSLAYVRNIVDTVREPLLVLDGHLRVQSANRSFYRTFGVSPPETEGRLLYELGNGQWAIPRLRTLLEEILPQDTAFDDFEIEHDFPDIGWKAMLLNARRLRQEGVDQILLAIEDVTERRRAEAERQEIDTRFTSLVKNVKDHAIFTLDPEGRVTSWNVASEQVLGYTEADALGQHFSFIFTPEDCQQGMPKAELRAAREQGRAEDERWHLRKGGERFWALGIVSALHDTEGRLTGFSKILRDMTAGKRAEEALQATEKRLRRMLNVDVVGVLIFDGSGTLVEANDAFLRMSGYGREEVQARALTWRVMTPPEHVAESNRQLRLLAETGRIGPYEKEYFRKDGSRVWMLFAGASLGDGTAVEYCVNVDDRRRAETAMRASEANYRALFEQAGDGIWLADQEGRFTDVNLAGCKLLGYSRDEHVRLTVRDIIRAEEAPRLRELMQALAAGQQITDVWNIRRADGTYILLELSHLITPAGFWRAIGRDITERVEAEKALRVSEERLKLATDATELAVFEWDLATDRVAANERFRQWYGFVAGEPMTGALLLQCVHPSDVMFVEEQVRQAMDPASSGRFSLEYRLAQADAGEERWILTHGQVYFEGAGNERRPVRVLGTNLDVTDRKRTEARLKESDRRKDEFLATLAHELRNPLAPIRTGLDLIQALRGDAAASEEPLRIMDRQLSHLVRLVDDLLDVSRISRGKIHLKRERLGLAEIIHAALDMSESSLSQGDRHVSVNVPSQPLAVEGDRVRLVQIFANLLNNAAKFTDAGGRIDIRVAPRGERVEIQVQDDGRGIPPERLGNIFEMFTQAEPGIGAGLGIGLSLVRGLVELHGGTVSAESQGSGCGATFTVSLPLCQSAPAQPAADEATEFDVLQTRCRVLAVDDNRDITEGLRLLLTILGAEVRVAHDGAEAVRICDDWLPTHVLMDIGMPGMDGYEAARRLRAKHPDNAFRLIAVTGWGQEEDRQRAREAGFDEHLVKPVGVRELKTVLSS
jgi:PAS domain S-box-containing protein